MKDFFVRSQRMLISGRVGPGMIAVVGGKMVAVGKPWQLPAGAEVHDYGNHLVFPGVIDTHVHINEPGRTEWEGFETATRAAAAGGVTMVADMPLNSSPVTTTLAALGQKRVAAQGKLYVDCGLHGGLVAGGAARVRELVDAGVTGIKAFMVHSGIDEFPASGEADLRAAMQALAGTGVPLLVHAELPREVEQPATSRRHEDWLKSRPPEMETEAIELLGRLAGETGVRVHVVHVSSAQGVALIRELKAQGIAITAETCPHYLIFTSDEIPEGATEFKCAPPIREAEHRQALWAGLLDGTLDLVASDHSPSPPEMKARESGDFFAAWGGIASLQFLLPAVWTGAKEHGVPVERLGEWLCAGPAKLLGVVAIKGTIAPGMDADLHVWDPDAEFVVAEDAILHRHKLTPHSRRRLQGKAVATYVRGELVFENGKVLAEPRGTVVERTPAG